eukprot:CAMPEP_0194260296 /NCGR_PEP_ID=MMETSP0158-20130606/45440_1 /TAXON_ID=33649 /ORGANISM="Thalassionema nitzschioides, Strain L26-B" /LENGTH=1678 /DNA_ID=CAMNT_0039000383 /DNA_START=47 /DNA_END=5080 /DNA_ORIENTATION=-
MVSPWVKEKRRLSEQGNLPADENINKKRRQTIGGVAPRNRSSQPDTLSTPLKKRISLGASASYFFSGMSKTPQSVQKSAKKKTEPIESPESGDDILSLQKDTTENLNTSFLSYASTSSEESSDIMNKSILSDTTELTASNFVLAATSRQKLADLAKIGKENFNVNSAGPKKDSAKEDIDEMPAPTPSPRSLRKLTESLRKDRLSNQEPITILDLKEEKSNLPTKTGSKLSPGQTRETSVKTLDKSKLDVSLSSMEDLFDGLLNKDSDESNASSLETSLLVSPRSNASPSIGVDDKSPIPSFKSPEMSPISLHAANDAPFLSNTKSNSATKLTPTKLNRSPRRILNPQRLDSPAKNTRNSAKKSPISKQVASDESLLSSKKNNGTVQPTAMDPEIVESLAKNTRIATLRSQVKSGDTKRKKDSVESLIPASPTYDTILSYGSRSKLALLANGSIPRSILNSAKKNFRAPDSISRKSVVFGSPEAAEYRIGSPSINLTPMPANEAKKLFSIPPDARKSDFEYSSSESTIEDETVDIEVNMSDLLQNAGVMESKSYANHLSVSSGKSDDDFNSKVASDTADIEVNLDAILRSAETNLSEERKNYLATTDDSIIKDLQEDKSIAKESIYRKMSESEVPSSILINISKESIQTENVNDSKQASVGTLEKELIASIQGTENDTRKDRVESPYAASPLMDVSTPDNLSTGTLEEQGSPKFEEGSSPSTRSNAESEAIDRQDALETRECDSNASPLIKTDTSLGDSKQGGIRGQGVSDFNEAAELEGNSSSLLKATDKIAESSPATSGIEANQSSPDQQNDEVDEQSATYVDQNEHEAERGNQKVGSNQSKTSDDEKRSPTIPGEVVPMDFSDSMSSPPKMTLPRGSEPMNESGKLSEEVDETKTIELEETMSSLLKASSRNSSSANAIAGEAEAIDLTENMSSPPKLSLPSDSSPMEESMKVNEERDETNTIELEETMSSLLKASSKDSHFEHKSVDAIAGEAEAMDLTENMSSPPKLSLPSSGNSPMEESMTVNEERDETKTIELEETVSSLLKVSSMDSNSETKALSANDIYVASSPDSSVDYASPDAEVGAFSSDETVELETDLSSILALATQRSENTGPLPSLKLTDKFPTMASNLVPKTNRMSFGYSLLNNSASKDNTLPLDFMASPMSLIGSDRKSLGSGRKSLGSQSRFSLRKAARLSISSAGEISFNSKVDESDILIEDDEDSSSEHSKEKDEIAQSFDVTSQELMQFVDFDVGMSVENPYDTFENSILSFCVNSNTVNSTISDSIQSFAEAVCGEVEEKVAVSSDSEACYSSFLSNISDDKLKFQLWLRNDSNNSEIHLISNSIKVLVQHEWLTWEKMVADSLLNAIDQIADEYAAEDGNLTKFTKMLEEMNDVINTQKGKAAERAKQRTMASHKEKSKELRNAVEKLENEIKQQMKDLELVEKSFSASESILNTTQEFITLQQSVVDSKRGAEGSQRSYQSLKGITKIYPSSIQGSHISLEFCGSNPFLSKAVRLVYTEKGTIQCLLEDTSPHDVNRRWEVNRLSKDALAYAKCRFKIVCDVMEQKQLENADDMRCLIRQFDWTMGRLEATANELTVLQKRFDISLENDPEGAASDFLVHISFKGNNGGSLIATFELDPSYPFAPLQVSLTPEGMEVDLDSLQRSLLNNAKPGFG